MFVYRSLNEVRLFFFSQSKKNSLFKRHKQINYNIECFVSYFLNYLGSSILFKVNTISEISSVTSLILEFVKYK